MDDATKAAILAQEQQKNKPQASSSGSTVSVFELVGFAIAGFILWPHIKKVIG